jgi:DNA adenine methylase
MGGKRKLAPRILTMLPPTIDTYYEPFLGGGAVMLLVLAERRAKRVVATDANPFLVAAWRAIAKSVGRVVTALEKCRKAHSREFFEEVRARLNASKDVGFQQGVDFLYLQGAGFNGLWRVNSEGRYNVPWGDRKADALFQPAALRAVASQVRDVEFAHRAWGESLATAGHEDAVYLDPPFVTATAAGFDDYVAGGFGDAEQVALAESASRARARGACIVASNADLPRARAIWRDFPRVSVPVAYSVAADGGARGPRSELLIGGAAIANEPPRR